LFIFLLLRGSKYVDNILMIIITILTAGAVYLIVKEFRKK